MMVFLGGPRQGGGGADVETAREEMRLFRGRCSFVRRQIFYCCADTCSMLTERACYVVWTLIG